MAKYPRFFVPPSGSYFLFGPRGTGKSTWLAEHCSGATWVDLLDPPTQREYLAGPERLRDLVRAARGRNPVVIDEIQRVPQLLPVVHQMIERDRALRFVLTGSSARKLRQAGVDLLGGRAVRASMHPFMACEMGDHFDLDESLRRGMVPLIRMAEDPDRTQRGYIDLYMQQEVKAEGLVRRLDDFSRFLEAISFSHAQILNVAAVARDCSATRNTVESYVTILEDLLLASRLPVFSRRAKRATVSHSKFYFFDCGVYRSLRPSGPIDPREEIVSPALEGLVFQHLRAWIDYRGSNMQLHYWRTQGGSEVDFVLYGIDGFYALEVKNTRSIRPQDLRGLRAFREDYPESNAVLLYRGRETLERSGVLAMPVESFLEQLHPEALLPAL
jgi:predicted AAA+ superfamily ATPase